jgi:hypothetical protein
MIVLLWLIPVAVGVAGMLAAYRFGIHEGRARVRDDRDALAVAAHKHFCVLPDEPSHEPDSIDYDKADEVIEILWRLDGAS